MQALKLSEDWRPFIMDKNEQMLYDVKTFAGEVVRCCWPKDNMFICCLRGVNRWVPVEDIAYIRMPIYHESVN